MALEIGHDERRFRDGHAWGEAFAAERGRAPTVDELKEAAQRILRMWERDPWVLGGSEFILGALLALASAAMGDGGKFEWDAGEMKIEKKEG